MQLKLNWKVNRIKFAYDLLGLIELACIYFIGWFNGRFIEINIIVPLTFIYKSFWDKQWHAKTLIKCAFYSVLVFAFVSLFVPSKNISILCSVIIPYFVTLISYHCRVYSDNQKLLTKKLESMTIDEMKARFTNFTEYEIKAVYEYINRGTKLADNIAMKYNYSTRQLQRLIKKMKDDLK